MALEKVLAVGRGAVGLTLFENIPANHDVKDFAFLADEKRLERYRKNQLTINGIPAYFHYVSSPETFGQADLILIACKFTQFETVMDEIAPFVKEGTVILSALNGICTEDMLRKRFPEAVVFRSIAQNMDSVYLNDHLTYHSRGQFVMGMDEPGHEKLFDETVKLLKDSNVPVVLSDNIVRDQWKKLMANCAVNQICAAFDLTYGGMLQNAKTRAMFLEAMDEVRKVANAKGIDLTRQDMAYWVESAMKWNPDAMPSMEQDMKAHRKSELALFSGTVVPMADSLGIKVPVLKELEELIKKREASFQ